MTRTAARSLAFRQFTLPTASGASKTTPRHPLAEREDYDHGSSAATVAPPASANPSPPAPSPKRRGGERQALLPLSAPGRGPGGGVVRQSLRPRAGRGRLQTARRVPRYDAAPSGRADRRPVPLRPS